MNMATLARSLQAIALIGQPPIFSVRTPLARRIGHSKATQMNPGRWAAGSKRDAG